jgi:hypothetical protein
LIARATVACDSDQSAGDAGLRLDWSRKIFRDPAAGGGLNAVMNRFLLPRILTISAGVFASGLIFAQDPVPPGGPGVVDPGHPRINEVNQREANQQRRINQGTQSGQLTSKEAANLQQRETALQTRENKMIARDGGHLTKRDQRRLNKQENRDSRAIYRKKHNPRTAG